jgi:hypothetical protein
MTGEITLRGEVLPIGGLKEKLLAAVRGGIRTALIPEENVKDLAEIPDNIKNESSRSFRSSGSIRCWRCWTDSRVARRRCPARDDALLDTGFFRLL